MTWNEKAKAIKIKELLFVVKFASLLFATIGYFRYFTFNLPDDNNLLILNTFNTSYVLFFMALAFILWIFFEKKEKQSNKIFYRFAQPLTFILFFLGAIIVTGTYKSNFKYLFLFLIVSYTIEWGLKSGLCIAGISSSIVIAMDLFLTPKSIVNYYFEDDLSLIGLFFIVAATIGFYVKIENEHIRSLSEVINQDSLTGLFNHRYFQENIKISLEKAKKNNQLLSLFLCDLDYFKQYNDIHGHKGGDELLRKVSLFLIENLDEDHFVFRYGGDEFAVILPNISNDKAYSIGEQLRKKFSETKFDGQEFMPNENITLSIGISTFDPKSKVKIDLLRSADEALYKAKYFRRNRVESYFSILDDLQLLKNDDIESEKVISSIRTLISVINSRDQFTYSHLQRVVAYCKLVADDFKLNEKDKELLYYAAYIHDIGKIDISKDIIMKSGPLTKEEWRELEMHSKIGSEMISIVDSLKDVAPIILQHHERYDGTGYPNKLKGNNIIYLARILTVIDSFDAMTSQRPYQKTKTFVQGIEELKKCSGTQFDSEIVDIFINSISEKEFSEQFLLT